MSESLSLPPTSPRLVGLTTALDERPAQRDALLDAFWREVAATGAPLIENVSEPENRALVTFLWRETAPTSAVRISEVASWKPEAERLLSRLPGTDIWHLSWDVVLTLRGSYGFVVTREGTAEPDDPRRAPGEPDPFNAHNIQSDWGIDEIDSVLEMPNATPLPWVAPRGKPIAGTIAEYTFTSSILGNERPVWVYTPPGYTTSAEPYPFVVIFDGEAFHSGPRVLDALITAGEIPPVAAILVNQIGIRAKELTCNPEFSLAVATELIPWVRESYHLSTDPSLAALNGRSFGGLCSAYTALKHPDVFGNVFMQSGSCWYHPSLPLRVPGAPEPRLRIVGTTTAIPSIISEYMASPSLPIRIFQECGDVENGPVIAEVWQTFGNRWFHDILTLKGYDTVYREFNGGHDDAWWRGTFADGIRWLFGPNQD